MADLNLLDTVVAAQNAAQTREKSQEYQRGKNSKRKPNKFILREAKNLYTGSGPRAGATRKRSPDKSKYYIREINSVSSGNIKGKHTSQKP